jgi:hypothetical protein
VVDLGKLSRDVSKNRDKVWVGNGPLRGERLPDNVTKRGRDDNLGTSDSEVSRLWALGERDGGESDISIYEFLVDSASVLAPGESLDNIYLRWGAYLSLELFEVFPRY